MICFYFLFPIYLFIIYLLFIYLFAIIYYYLLFVIFIKAGANVTVFRNDKISIQECEQFNPTHIVISPGPGKPSGI